MASFNKEDVLEKYFALSRKLGKIPSRRETNKFICSNDVISRLFSKHTNLVKEAKEKYPILEDLEVPVKITTADVESYRLSLEKKQNKKFNSKKIEDSSFFDYLEKFSDQVFSGRVANKKIKYKNNKIKRVHNLVLSDLHFGADLRGDETGSVDYGVKEEARRFAKIIKEAAKYKQQYKRNTELHILLLGDVIENSMHDPRTGAVIAEQCARAIHLLVQGITHLSNYYPKVVVHCATGNHDRITSRHQTRAIHQKYDSYSTIIYYAIKKALDKVENVSFDIPKAPIGNYSVLGHKIGFTHGDTVIRTGNPGNNINIKALENQINKMNAHLSDNDEYKVLVYGHTHQPHIVHLANGSVLVGNGALPPPDHYAASIGVFEAYNGQYIFETVEEYPVGDFRLIKTGTEYDKDESLDNIIKPWHSFND